MNRRDITADEIEAIARLAARFPDLRAIEPLIDELQGRCDDLAGLAIGTATVQPKSVADLLLLKKEGIVDDGYIRARLGIEEIPATEPAPEGAPEAATPQLEQIEQPYRVTDRRASG